METLPITALSFEKDHHINGDNFERSYKETISGFKTWEDADHAEDWVIIPKNMGTHLSIDETCLSTGEVYTILSNKEAHGRKGCLVAIVKGTKAKEVTSVLKKMPEARAMIKDLIKSGKPLVDAEGNPIRSNAAYHPERLRNNETKAELLMRSKYLLMVSPEKWTPSQRERAEILFELYPDIETA